MAKNKKAEKPEKPKKPKKPEKARKREKKNKKNKKNKKAPGLAAKVAMSAGKLAAGVVIEEIVAATLVAAAAAIRDPKKARAMAAAAGSELKALTNEATKEGSALWKLALDVAGQSLQAIDATSKAKSAPAAKPSRSRVPRKLAAS
jgi:hypothetical protein